MMFAPREVGPPVALEPGEAIVMSGGRSWHFWLYTVVFLPMLCAMRRCPFSSRGGTGSRSDG
jgi:hypothetical protein